VFLQKKVTKLATVSRRKTFYASLFRPGFYLQCSVTDVMGERRGLVDVSRPGAARRSCRYREISCFCTSCTELVWLLCHNKHFTVAVLEKCT